MERSVRNVENAFMGYHGHVPSIMIRYMLAGEVAIYMHRLSAWDVSEGDGDSWLLYCCNIKYKVPKDDMWVRKKFPLCKYVIICLKKSECGQYGKDRDDSGPILAWYGTHIRLCYLRDDSASVLAYYGILFPMMLSLDEYVPVLVCYNALTLWSSVSEIYT